MDSRPPVEPGGEDAVTIAVNRLETGEISRSSTAEGEKDGAASPPETSPSLFHKFIFVLMGAAALICWNALLTILWALRDEVYPDYPSMTDSLNGADIVGEFVGIVICIWTGAMDQPLVLSAGGVLTASCIAFALISQFAPGLTGVISLHLVACVTGVACSFYEAGVFGLASALPVPMTNYSSLGQGICGLVIWALWIIIRNSGLDVKAEMWALMGCGAGILLLSLVLYTYLILDPPIREQVKRINETLKNEATDPDMPSYRFLFIQCWQHLLTIYLVYAFTCFIFPDIGPMGWNDGWFTDYVTGAHQIGDVLGRFAVIPMPFLIMSPKTCLWLSISRAVLIVFAVVCYFKSGRFWGSWTFHFLLMVVVAVTNGVLTSCVFNNTPLVIHRDEWKSRISSMVICGIVLGIATGLWGARIFTAVAN